MEEKKETDFKDFFNQTKKKFEFDLKQYEKTINHVLSMNKIIKKWYKKTKKLEKIIKRFNYIFELYTKAMVLSQFSNSFKKNKKKPPRYSV